MTRIFLEYRGHQMALAPGVHIIGRGLGCAMRLNDQTVSREHLRLDVGINEILATDLGSRNGTLVNGKPAEHRCVLQDRDVLQVGGQEVCIRVVWGPEALFDEQTEDRRTGQEPAAPVRPTRPTPDRLTALDNEEAKRPLPLPQIDHLDCPKCRNRVPAEQGVCPNCGHQFPGGGPSFITQVFHLEGAKSKSGAERRLVPRVPVEVLLLYVSENLSLNAVARDLSLGGVYVATDLLDEVGTTCDITFLPEARPAVQCRGVVRHVSRSVGSGPRPAGMGVQFTHLGLGGKEWLNTLIKHA